MFPRDGSPENIPAALRRARRRNMVPLMRPAAASFAVRGESPARTVRALREVATSIGRSAGGLLFTTGLSEAAVGALAQAIARAELGCPLLLANGAGVLTERGEIEGEAATAGLLWSSGEAKAWTVADSASELCSAVGRRLSERSPAPEAALVLLKSAGLRPDALEALHGLKLAQLIGAGTVGDADVYAVTANGELSRGQGGALVLGGNTPLVTSSPACRLLMPLREITKTRGSMVLSIEGEPALEVLSAVAEALVDQPLVFVALANESGHDGLLPPLLLRAVQGVDPARHGLVISEEVRPGMRLAFAVRDAAAAKADLELRSRELLRQAAGAAPRFGIYLDCTGRGTSLYQKPGVDLRILKARFGEIPWLGLSSSFEIAPYAGNPAMQLYSGVIGLFTAPS
jgi:small ligand-binding sensory domain FIST